MTTGPAYASALALASAQVIAAVHRADCDAIRRHIRAALTLTLPEVAPEYQVNPFEALVTVLAAQVNPDTSLSERLVWVSALPTLRAAA